MFAVWLLGLLGCQPVDETRVEDTAANGVFEWDLPEGVPPPKVPEDNPMTTEKVALGRVLFYEERLSLEELRPCGICHEQAKAFTDGFPRSVGATQQFHPHNSLPTVNVGYREMLGWAQTDLVSLEEQLLVPLLGEDPIEMGGDIEQIEALINTDELLTVMFEDAFPGEERFQVDHVAKAIAAFERTVISVNSPWDQYERGDATAVGEAAIRGFELFRGAAGCWRCHSGLDYNQPADASGAVVGPPGYHNLGLYDIDGLGGYPPGREGLINETGEAGDMGRFRTPTLRNLVWSEPYFHDGTAPTLAFVLEILNRGGRVTEGGPYPGDGANNPHKDPLIQPLGLSEGELVDLEAFLLALSDPTFVVDPRYSDPFPPED